MENVNNQSVTVKTEKDEIFGSFFLDENEFAISVKSVQEVVNAPESYAALPLAPPYLLGLFNLRGTIIPVIDLRKILKLKDSSTKIENRKIAVIEYGQFYVGLVFDKTGEVFRSRAEDHSVFDFKPGTANKDVIKGAFKLNGGKRIVQILDAKALLELDNVPYQGNHQSTAMKKKKGMRKQCISFLVGPARCALGIESIQEIIKAEKIDVKSLAVDHCIGAIDVRGNTVPVVDFAALLGYREADTSETATQGERRIVMIKHEDGLFGLLVDSIESIVTYFAEELLAFPNLSKEKQKLFLGCITKENSDDVLLLRVEEILSNDEVTTMTQGHSRVFKENRSQAATAQKRGERKTYITFHIGNLFAVEINEVREVIDLPEQLLHPPTLPKYFLGMLNLRGDLVAIVDTRKLYEIPKTDSSLKQKVLIFLKDGTKYGLIVDSVDAILSFFESDKIKVPELLYKNTYGKLSEDVVDVVQVEGHEGAQNAIFLLNMVSVYTRLQGGTAEATKVA